MVEQTNPIWLNSKRALQAQKELLTQVLAVESVSFLGAGGNGWSYGVMVSTLDFESSDPSSNLGRTYVLFASLGNCHVGVIITNVLSRPTSILALKKSI